MEATNILQEILSKSESLYIEKQNDLLQDAANEKSIVVDLLYYKLSPTVTRRSPNHSGTCGDIFLSLTIEGYLRVSPGFEFGNMTVSGYINRKPYPFNVRAIPVASTEPNYMPGLFKFRATFPNADSCSESSSLQVRSHIWAKYTVNGKTYWVNNGGYQKDYHYSGTAGYSYSYLGNSNQRRFDIGNKNLILDFAESNTIILRNIKYRKIVKIVYSHDNWKTVRESNAWFSNMLRGGELEQWHFNIPGKNSNTQFAISYKVDGQEFWDNNYGRNYRIYDAIGNPTPIGFPIASCVPDCGCLAECGHLNDFNTCTTNCPCVGDMMPHI